MNITGFYATTNEAITIVPESNNNRSVHIRGTLKQARTTMQDLPDKMWVENITNPEKSKKLKDGEVYFSLKSHMDALKAQQEDVKKWSF